jgi:hypothetical protein
MLAFCAALSLISLVMSFMLDKAMQAPENRN